MKSIHLTTQRSPVLPPNGVRARWKVFLETDFFKTEPPFVDTVVKGSGGAVIAITAMPSLLGVFFNFDFTLPPSDEGSLVPSLGGTTGCKPSIVEKIDA